VKHLLILDLDETLIHSTTQKLKHKETFLFENYFVYARPHLNWFLNEAANPFRIGIWSAADELYVSSIVEKILPNNIKLEIMWGQSWCNYKLNSETNTYVYEKDINTLTKLNFKLEEIIYVDDSLYNAKVNKGNAIIIKPFFGDQNDQELKTLFDYLLTLRNIEDIRNIDRNGI
jgi:RNA polymerase II subunit A small phosphatase-like protein